MRSAIIVSTAIAASGLLLLSGCSCAPAASVSSAAPTSAVIQGSDSTQPSPEPTATAVPGIALPTGQLNMLVDYDDLTGARYGPVIISGDTPVHHAASSERAELLTDLSTGIASYYAAGKQSTDGAYLDCTVYDSNAKAVYTCADGQTPVCTNGKWLLVGKIADGGGWSDTLFVNPSTGETKKGPTSVWAAEEGGASYGASANGGFWLNTGKADAGTVTFYDSDAKELASAKGAVMGFTGSTAYLSSSAGSLTPVDLSTGKAGSALAKTDISWLGYSGYTGVYHDGKTDVYDAAGTKVSTVQGWCVFYNGKAGVVLDHAPTSTYLPNDYVYMSAAESGMQLAFTDGESLSAEEAAWNAKTGSVSMQSAGTVTVYDANGTVLQSFPQELESPEYTLLSDGELAVYGGLNGGKCLRMYENGASTYEFTNDAAPFTVWFSPASSLPVITAGEDNQQAVLLKESDGSLSYLGYCVPLSDSRIAVRQGNTLGLISANGAWLWANDTMS